MLKNTLALGLALLTCAATGCATHPETKRAAAELKFEEGKSFEEQGDVSKAATSYQASIRRDGSYLPPLRRLAQIKADQGKYAAAIPLLEKAVEKSKGSADAYNDLAYCYDMAGFADLAEAAFISGVKADPSNARIHTNYGLMLVRHGRTNEALLQLRLAMEPADVHYNVALVLEGQGKRAHAKREFKRALDLDPEHADAELHLTSIDFEAFE